MILIVRELGLSHLLLNYRIWRWEAKEASSRIITLSLDRGDFRKISGGLVLWKTKEPRRAARYSWATSKHRKHSLIWMLIWKKQRETEAREVTQPLLAVCSHASRVFGGIQPVFEEERAGYHLSNLNTKPSRMHG